jgi:hypothetical protein
MAGVVELHGEVVKGKQTRGGRPLPEAERPKPEPVVTLVTHGEIDRFLGARNLSERTAHLRRLRDDGLLISRGGGRLYQDVRGQGVRTAYVFRCEAHEVPLVSGARPGRKRKTGSVGRVGTF